MNKTYIISKALTNTAKKIFGEDLIDYVSISLPKDWGKHTVVTTIIIFIYKDMKMFLYDGA